MRKILILSIFLLASCSLNKIVQHHGVHNLEIKQAKLKINVSNKNDIFKLIGPPSTQSTFDNDLYIYVERKTSGTKLVKMGKKKLIKNDVLVLEIDNKGILISKKFYNKNEMNEINFDEDMMELITPKDHLYIFLTTLRQKIDDPLGKKRIKN